MDRQITTITIFKSRCGLPLSGTLNQNVINRVCAHLNIDEATLMEELKKLSEQNLVKTEHGTLH